MTDKDIINALGICTSEHLGCEDGCPYIPRNIDDTFCGDAIRKDALDLINRQQAEIEKLTVNMNAFGRGMQIEAERAEKAKAEAVKEIDRLYDAIDELNIEIAKLYFEKDKAKTEAIKELSEKITEIFMRYSHLHSYAEGARKDYIETVDEKEIEVQSVWDVITLQKNGMAEYEEMSRLQKNIETIEKERLLTELEKDFRLLIKEMVGAAE